jgi:sporulation protein YtfJ
MSEHPIKGLMQTAMENLKEMIDVNTIIGDPVETPDGSVIITVSKVGFGFAAGGSQFQQSGQPSTNSRDQDQGNKEHSLPFGGGSGGGVSITPIAFLIVSPSGVKTIHLKDSTHIYERLLDLAPQVVDKIQQMLKTSQQKSNNNNQSNYNNQSNNNQNKNNDFEF